MSNPNQAASTELAITEQQARGVPVALTGRQSDFDATYRLAKNLAMSGLLPKDVRGKPADVLVTILYGQELGIAPMQALQSIYVVNSRPTISAQLWVALARRAGHKVRVTNETPETCTVEVERSDDPGHPTRVTYTLDQAKKAGLAGKDIWKGHTHAMLYARAVSTACRRACPEIALGFGDDVDQAAPEPVRPTLAQVAAERTDQSAGPAVVSVPEAVPVAPVPDAEPTADDYAAIEAAYAETVEPAGDFGGGS